VARLAWPRPASLSRSGSGITLSDEHPARLGAHGRFDYVLPVGPPDEEARQAIWDRYLRAIPHGELDLAAVVAQSALFTPVDIEFAARRTAQIVFERVLSGHSGELAETADVLRGVAETRRTLTPQMVAEFEQDITDFART
jgi:transitional endoplasmic reticulum ATPase